MIDTTLTILLALAFSYYLSFLWIVWRGLKSTVQPGPKGVPTVSIIVAARNEEHSIGPCLESLTRQDYDGARYEIVIVDDHSNDHTRALATEYSDKITRPRIKVVALDNGTGELGKPAAIARGVEASNGEIILCTDADCIVPTSWIRSMTGCFEQSVAFVAGPVKERTGKNLLTALQSLEFLGLLTTAAGLIGSGRPIICNGANIAYRRSSFQAVQGFGQSKSSCDDETLMQRMIAKNIGRVVFNADPQAMVATITPSSIREFWSQRTRWAAKRGRYDDPLVLIRLITLYVFFVALLLSALASILLPVLGPVVVAVVILKALAEYVVLHSGARLFEVRLRLHQFLIAEVFHVPYIVIAAAIGQIKSMRWKDRTLDQ